MQEEEYGKKEGVIIIVSPCSSAPTLIHAQLPLICAAPALVFTLLAMPPVQSPISNLIHILYLPGLSPTCIVGYQYLENKKIVSFYQSHLLYLMCYDESKK